VLSLLDEMIWDCSLLHCPPVKTPKAILEYHHHHQYDLFSQVAMIKYINIKNGLFLTFLKAID
jgi:hypothetical protein